MRVPTITIYNQAAYRLNRLTSDLSQANQEVSTGLAIRTASDDPSGMDQVLSIDSTVSVLTQSQANIEQAQALATDAETALDAMADILSELNLLCAQLANASASAQERTDAADSMQTYLDQILDLANTKSYGSYLFAGDDNQTAPFAYDDPDTPAAVTYGGSEDPVTIKTGDDTRICLDVCGCDLFYEDEILVDDSNNTLVFIEDPSTATEDIQTLEVRIPDGSYTRESLARAVETAMTEGSADQGYGVVYEVSWDETANTFSVDTDGVYDGQLTTTLVAAQDPSPRISNLNVTSSATSGESGGDAADYSDLSIDIVTPDTLSQFTPEPEGTAPLTLTYSGTDRTWTVDNDPGYGLPATIEANGNQVEIDVDDDGIADIVVDLGDAPQEGTRISFDIVEGYENNSILPDLGFEDAAAITQATGSAVSGPFIVTAGENDAIDFTETLYSVGLGDGLGVGSGDGSGSLSAQLTAIIEPGTYTDPETYARAVEAAMETASAENGNRINYAVVYNENSQMFTITEDTDTGRQLSAFTLLFGTGTHSAETAAEDLGFAGEDVSPGAATGAEATWSIFDTILDLEQGLAANDVDSIQRAMVRLGNHYESITSAVSSVGRTYDRLTASAALASETQTTMTERLSQVQDADAVTSIMTLNAVQTTYEAALSASAKVLGLSLVDYL